MNNNNINNKTLFKLLKVMQLSQIKLIRKKISIKINIKIVEIRQHMM